MLFCHFSLLIVVILLAVFFISITELKASHSQVHIGNTTSIGEVYMDHLNPPECRELRINNIESSVGGPVSKERLMNLIDNNRSSIWVTNSLETQLRLDLGTEEQLCYVEIAWQGGTTHYYNYTVYVSNDHAQKKVGELASSGKSEFPEPFILNHQNGRYVDIMANGSNTGNRTAIAEIKVYGVKK
jgi:hypothetical protein